MRAAVQAFFLLLIAASCGAVAHWLRPDALPWDARDREIVLEQALALDNPLWIDARVEEDFQRASLPGAISLTLENWETGFSDLLATWTPERPIVIFCSSQACMRSHEVAERLRAELGVEDVHALAGGWESLEKAGMAGVTEGQP